MDDDVDAVVLLLCIQQLFRRTELLLLDFTDVQRNYHVVPALENR